MIKRRRKEGLRLAVDLNIAHMISPFLFRTQREQKRRARHKAHRDRRACSPYTPWFEPASYTEAVSHKVYYCTEMLRMPDTGLLGTRRRTHDGVRLAAAAEGFSRVGLASRVEAP